MVLRVLIVAIAPDSRELALGHVAVAAHVPPERGACAEALVACAPVARVLLLGVLRVGEAFERVKDVLEHLHVDVARPQEVEVLVMRDLGGHRLPRQLAQHHLDVDERVAAAVHEHDGRPDVARRVAGDLGVLGRGAQRRLVVVHLEGLGADDLEPVDDGLGAGEGVQVRIGRQLLRHGNVLCFPVEEEPQADVNSLREYRRVQDRLPHCGRAEDGTPPKEEEEHLR